MDNSSLAHTMWTCKYHIVFAPKYRRKIIYKKIREDIIHIFKELCKRKGVEIIAGECCSDHVHMLISIPPKYSVSEVMGYLKGKSSLMVFERHANLKYKYGNRHVSLNGISLFSSQRSDVRNEFIVLLNDAVVQIAVDFKQPLFSFLK